MERNSHSTIQISEQNGHQLICIQTELRLQWIGMEFQFQIIPFMILSKQIHKPFKQFYVNSHYMPTYNQ